MDSKNVNLTFGMYKVFGAPASTTAQITVQWFGARAAHVPQATASKNWGRSVWG